MHTRMEPGHCLTPRTKPAWNARTAWGRPETSRLPAHTPAVSSLTLVSTSLGCDIKDKGCESKTKPAELRHTGKLLLSQAAQQKASQGMGGNRLSCPAERPPSERREAASLARAGRKGVLLCCQWLREFGAAAMGNRVRGPQATQTEPPPHSGVSVVGLGCPEEETPHLYGTGGPRGHYAG